MPSKLVTIILKYTNIVIGLLFLILGAATFYYPDLFTILYGVELPTPESRVAIRAIIGGGELGLGICFLFGTRYGLTNIALTRLALTVFCSVVLARVIAIFLERSFSLTLLRELAIEAVILFILGWLARKSS